VLEHEGDECWRREDLFHVQLGRGSVCSAVQLGRGSVCSAWPRPSV
jgi:hypothetical protein